MRAKVYAGAERGAGVVALPVVTQLAHGCILADTLDGILLDDLAHRLGEQEAGRVEPLT